MERKQDKSNSKHLKAMGKEIILKNLYRSAYSAAITQIMARNGSHNYSKIYNFILSSIKESVHFRKKDYEIFIVNQKRRMSFLRDFSRYSNCIKYDYASFNLSNLLPEELSFFSLEHKEFVRILLPKADKLVFQTINNKQFVREAFRAIWENIFFYLENLFWNRQRLDCLNLKYKFEELGDTLIKVQFRIDNFYRNIKNKKNIEIIKLDNLELSKSIINPEIGNIEDFRDYKLQEIKYIIAVVNCLEISTLGKEINLLQLELENNSFMFNFFLTKGKNAENKVQNVHSR